MSTLAIDVRNSIATVGLFDGEELIDSGRMASNVSRTADEWHVLLDGLLKGAEVTGISMACTVPSILSEMRILFAQYFPDVKTVIVEPGTKTGVPIHTDNPKEVGADRIVNAVAAKARYGGPAVVVDFGTATTFDVIDANGNYIGGAISPWIEISLEALARKGAQLRSVELVAPNKTIGKNTVEAMQAGIVFGFAGLVDGVVDRILDEIVGDDIPVIATGFAANSVWQECETVTNHEPNLTLDGLRIVLEKN